MIALQLIIVRHVNISFRDVISYNPIRPGLRLIAGRKRTPIPKSTIQQRKVEVAVSSNIAQAILENDNPILIGIPSQSEAH